MTTKCWCGCFDLSHIHREKVNCGAWLEHAQYKSIGMAPVEEKKMEGEIPTLLFCCFGAKR